METVALRKMRKGITGRMRRYLRPRARKAREEMPHRASRAMMRGSLTGHWRPAWEATMRPLTTAAQKVTIPG